MFKFIKKINLVYVVLLLSPLLVSCASTPQEKNSEAELIQCVSPKPQVCTREHRPVCGFEDDGNYKTFSNSCAACASPEVTSYCDGDCNELKSLSK